MPLESLARSASALVTIQEMNSSASSGWLLSLVTMKVEPPWVPRTGFFRSHCGKGAMAHLPLPPGVEAIIEPAAQAPASQPAVSPLCRCARHCWLDEGSTRTRSSSSRRCQYVATLRVGASSMDTRQVSPVVSYHCAPACQLYPAMWRVPPVVKRLAIRELGSAFFSLRAELSNSAQVLGTGMPCLVNRSLRYRKTMGSMS